ncbi:hypothetical protein OV079_48960 [Nannocystis pusilla]|uniref:Uncharacterized protein n=1 Tax=Nannocystis pusilla TaxID=889268 RepID=A0A9X3J217_9BACT|nr:hypothetical protein [Nannocystis pusilla]MCY1013332.1 hypothetical protein [Nannocystis pusilla]
MFELGDFGESDEFVAAPDEPAEEPSWTGLGAGREQARARDDALDDACRRLTEGVEGALACALVAVEGGDLLGHHRRKAAGPTSEAALSAAARELFGGTSRLAGGRLHEVQLTASDHYLFGKLLGDRRRALLLVTDRTISVGFGWAMLRAQLGALELPAR